MNDRGLLEAAAKAAGVDLLDWRESWADYAGPAWRTTTRELWNPMTDDGDALRLAVGLSIEIQPYKLSGITCAGHVLRAHQRIEVLHAGDSMQSTRRAIVLAAAEMCPRRLVAWVDCDAGQEPQPAMFDAVEVAQPALPAPNVKVEPHLAANRR